MDHGNAVVSTTVRTTVSTTVPAAHTCLFGPVTIAYDERVLTPRGWTLAQSMWASDLARERDVPRCLELCAGAGQIGLAAAVLTGRHDLELVQVEVDPIAAGYAAANARRAGLGDRVQIRVAPLQASLDAGETFPLVIADPPYLTSASIGRWREDPQQAIDGGPDGLDVTRLCVRLAAGHLDAGGSMLLQVAGPTQAAQIDRLLHANPSWELHARELRTTDEQRSIMRIDRG